MKGMVFAALLVGAMPWVAGSGVSAQDGDILQKAINTPGVAYSVYGPAQTTKMVKSSVQGGQALQVDVQAKGADPWTVGANAPITRPIAKGDRIVLAFWARAPRLQGDATTPIAFAGVTGAATPYTQIIGKPIAVTREWTLHQVTGVSSGDFAKGSATVTLHLAAAKALLELGPVFVLDLRHASQ